MKPNPDTTMEFFSRGMLALVAAALDLLLCACSGPAPEAAEGTVAATAPEPEPEATADASADEPNAAPVADERPRPPDDADPLVIAEYYFEPEVWAAVHRPPDRVPDEVLVVLGKELVRLEQVNCQQSFRADRKLRIISPPYGFYQIPFETLRQKDVEEVSDSDFHVSHWGFPFSCSSEDIGSKMLRVALRDGKWEAMVSNNMGFPTRNFLVFERRNKIGLEHIQRRGLGIAGLDAYYLILIPENGSHDNWRCHFVDPMWEKHQDKDAHKKARDFFMPLDEPVGFREMVEKIKNEIIKFDRHTANKEKGQNMAQPVPSNLGGPKQ